MYTSLNRVFAVALLIAALATTVAVNADEAAASDVRHPHLRVMSIGDSLTFGVGDGCEKKTCYSGYRELLWQNLTRAHNKYEFESVGTVASGSSRMDDRNHEGHIGWTARMFMQDCGLGADAKSSIDPDKPAFCIDRVVKEQQPDIILIHLGTASIDGEQKGFQMEIFQLKTLINRLAKIRTSAIFVSTIGPVKIPPNVNKNANFNANKYVSDFNDAVRGLFYPDGNYIPPATLFLDPTRTIGTWQMGSTASLSEEERSKIETDLRANPATPFTGVVRLVDMAKLSGVTVDDLNSDGINPNAAGYAKLAAVWTDAIWTFLSTPPVAPIVMPDDIEIEAPASARGARPTEKHASAADDEFEFDDWQVVLLLVLAVVAFGAAVGLGLYSILFPNSANSLLPDREP